MGTSKNYIIQNIYMHQKEYCYLDTFINHVNSILKSITFYHDKDNIFKIDTDLVNDKYELNALSVDILIHEDIASVLGISSCMRISTLKAFTSFLSFTSPC